MPIKTRKILYLYRLLNFFAFALCFYLIIFVSPLKEILLPPLKRFVVSHVDALVNIIWLIFIIGSTSLTIIFWWIHDSDKQDKSRAKEYLSQLVAKDYYKGMKKIDYYRAVKAALSKHSRHTPGEEVAITQSYGTSGSDVKPSEADHARMELESITALPWQEEEGGDKSDGTHRYLYPNGTLRKEVTYKNGKLDNIFRTYYEDGTLHQERHYQDGLLSGIFKAYDEVGVPYFEMTYKAGVKHGVESGYYKNGVVEYEEIYEDGERVSRKTFDESGELQFKHTSKRDGDKDSRGDQKGDQRGF